MIPLLDASALWVRLGKSLQLLGDILAYPTNCREAVAGLVQACAGSRDGNEPLVPHEPVAVDVEIWPGSICLPAGSVLQLLVEHRDVDSPPERFGGRHTILTGQARESWLQLPVLPAA